MRKLLLVCCIALVTSYNLKAQTQPAPDYFKNLLAKNAGAIGIKSAELDTWRIADAHYDKSNDIVFMHLQQTYLGVDIDKSTNNLSFKNEKFSVGNFSALQNIPSTTKKATPAIDANTALKAAAASINANLKGLVMPLYNITESHTYIFDKLGISFNKIPVKLVWLADEKNNLQLAWQVTISSFENNALWQINIDALTGKVLNKINLTVYENETTIVKKPRQIFVFDDQEQQSEISPTSIKSISSAQYNVIAYPNESPLYSAPSLQTNPWTVNHNQNANTLKWNSDSITDYKYLRGNNVYVLQNLDSNFHTTGYSASSTTNPPDLTFNFTFNPDAVPTADPSFAETNLFYWDNLMHDVSYQYGFDEAAGNFQESNFSRGGKSNDFVYGLNQFGGGNGNYINNSNFATPADGSNPSQHMFLWNASVLKSVYVNSPAIFVGYKPAFESEISNNNKIASKGPITSDVVIWHDALHPDSSTGCGSALNAAAISGKIAYMDRGSCNFVIKFHNAQAAGAKALLVGNVASNDPRYIGANNTGDNLFAMGPIDSLDDTIAIPGFAIQYDTAVKLKNSGTVNITLKYSPEIDGSLDNTISTHEYTHGISNRLVGGPQNVSCLTTADHEQMGEGWSDWYALMMTENWSTASVTGDHIRSIGIYAFGLDTTYIGGFRIYPTSTNFVYDPWTYDSLKTLPNIPRTFPFRPDEHSVGEIWSSMLWDMTWDLIKDYGISQNIFDATGAGGNIIALKLVTTGLKLTKCSPGFTDGRDAILKADTLLYSGKYSPEIWRAFAKRGLGYSANEGTTSTTDGTPAYDLPPNILPVTIADFTAQKQGSVALLKWTTAEESNTDKFIVERTTDGKNYREIGEVKAAGYSSAAKAYQLTDAHPVNGNNIYRIKEVDKDGRYNLSDLRSLNFAVLQPYIAVGPNPTKNTVTINIPGNTDNINVRLVSNSGQPIISKIMNGETLTLNVAGLASGAYNIIIDGKGYSSKYKLIIQ